jgi:hypothetical protein
MSWLSLDASTYIDIVSAKRLHANRPFSNSLCYPALAPRHSTEAIESWQSMTTLTSILSLLLSIGLVSVSFPSKRSCSFDDELCALFRLAKHGRMTCLDFAQSHITSLRLRHLHKHALRFYW